MTRCQFKLKTGRKCTRNPIADQLYCWQHQKKVGKNPTDQKSEKESMPKKISDQKSEKESMSDQIAAINKKLSYWDQLKKDSEGFDAEDKDIRELVENIFLSNTGLIKEYLKSLINPTYKRSQYAYLKYNPETYEYEKMSQKQAHDAYDYLSNVEYINDLGHYAWRLYNCNHNDDSRETFEGIIDGFIDKHVVAI